MALYFLPNTLSVCHSHVRLCGPFSLFLSQVYIGIDSTPSADSSLFPQPRPSPKPLYTLMPMRPEKYLAALASAVPRLDPEPLTTRLDNQPPLPPPPTPPVAEFNAVPRRATTSQRPISLVVRNTKRSRNKPSHTSVPRSNHYLLARSLVENDRLPTPPAPERKPQAHKAASSRFRREALPPDFTISDFIWRSSTPDPDSQIHDALAALKSYDPQTFSEFIAGFD